MDKSDIYIDMCRKADGIQRQWMPEHGDFYLDGDGRIDCWIPHKDGGKEKRGAVHVSKDRGVIRLDRLIWLPRLNQLMELAQEPGCRFESMTHRFFAWCKTDYPPRKLLPGKIFSSLEQHWIAFVMMKNYRKVWDRSLWIPI